MDADYNATKGYLQREHYYGYVVRKFSLFGGVVMLVALPFFSDLLHINALFSIIAVLLVGFSAGFLNPVLRSVIVFNMLVSMAATLIFEYQAVKLFDYGASVRQTIFFAINQLLAVNFFFASYYGAKSARGLVVKVKSVGRTRDEGEYE